VKATAVHTEGCFEPFFALDDLHDTAALEALCRRFQGFAIERAIPEQTAALGALAGIGGSEAAHAVRRIIVERIVRLDIKSVVFSIFCPFE
jgi:hypothetical protein